LEEEMKWVPCFDQVLIEYMDKILVSVDFWVIWQTMMRNKKRRRRRKRAFESNQQRETGV